MAKLLRIPLRVQGLKSLNGRRNCEGFCDCWFSQFTIRCLKARTCLLSDNLSLLDFAIFIWLTTSHTFHRTSSWSSKYSTSDQNFPYPVQHEQLQRTHGNIAQRVPRSHQRQHFDEEEGHQNVRNVPCKSTHTPEHRVKQVRTHEQCNQKSVPYGLDKCTGVKYILCGIAVFVVVDESNVERVR